MARNKRSLTLYKFLSVAAVIIAAVALVQPYLTKVDATTKLLPIAELSTQGYTEVKVEVSASENIGLVTITGGCYQMTANTELSQVESISNGLEGRVDPRPNAHDLMRDALDSLDIQVVMVKIVDVQNNTFIGRLILKQGDKIVSLDSRPSDGIAIAVRTGAPIYIKDDLLKAQGKYIC